MATLSSSSMKTTATRKIHRFSGGQLEIVDDLLVVEQQVTLFVKNEKVLSTVCSPGKIRELAYGYLLSEGMIKETDDVLAYGEEEGRIAVSVRPFELEDSPTPISSSLRVSTQHMLNVAAQAHQRAEIFQHTGGTHAVSICDPSGGMIFVEDVSRTCALEKALGHALLGKTDFADSLIFLSSRIPTSMLSKIASCGIPIVGCVSAPTAQAVDLADKLGICLCGFVRGERMNIYSHEERVIS